MLRIWNHRLKRNTAAYSHVPYNNEIRTGFITRALLARYLQTSLRDASSTSSQVTWAQPRSPATSDAQRQTIYALATASGPSGIAVVRISGPRVHDVRARMVRPAHRHPDKNPVPWKLERCTVVDPETHEVLDDALAVFFLGACHF